MCLYFTQKDSNSITSCCNGLHVWLTKDCFLFWEVKAYGLSVKACFKISRFWFWKELTLLAFHIDIIYSDGTGTRTKIPGTRNQPKNGLKKQVEQAFSSFFANFFAYLLIFQSFAGPSVCSFLKNHQNIIILPPQTQAYIDFNSSDAFNYRYLFDTNSPCTCLSVSSF